MRLRSRPLRSLLTAFVILLKQKDRGHYDALVQQSE
jgi:hypothetical protein